MARKRLFRLLVLLCILGILISGYMIVSTLLEYRTGEQIYEQIQELAQLPTEKMPSAPTQADALEETESTVEGTTDSQDGIVYPEIDFAGLQAISPDVVGWIYIPDTQVNYPIVQGSDNDVYLSAMIDGTYNSAGSIFMDYRNSFDFSDRHTIVYGHNMGNGTMFAGISKYRNQSFYDAHPMGMIVTPEKQMHFEIVAAYVAAPTADAWQLDFEDDAQALRWVQSAMKRSGFKSNYQPQLQDRMITLSTCSYEMENARFVVVGILMDQ